MPATRSPAVPATAHRHSTAAVPTRGRRAAHHAPDGWRTTGRLKHCRSTTGRAKQLAAGAPAGLRTHTATRSPSGVRQSWTCSRTVVVVHRLGRSALQAGLASRRKNLWAALRGPRRRPMRRSRRAPTRDHRPAGGGARVARLLLAENRPFAVSRVAAAIPGRPPGSLRRHRTLIALPHLDTRGASTLLAIKCPRKR